MSGEKMKLYWFSGSTPCWRVQIVLEEKGFYDKVDLRHVDFYKQEQKSAEVTKLNPRGQVPTFVDDGININESHAICDYLETCYGEYGKKLVPSEKEGMSRVLQRMHEAHNNFQRALIENIIYYCLEIKKENWNQELLEAKYEIARKELQRWEDYLMEVHEEGQTYIVGDDFTMADIYLYPHVAFCVRFGLDISKYPELEKYYNTLAQRHSIKKTWPPTWKSSEDKYRFLVPL